MDSRIASDQAEGLHELGKTEVVVGQFPRPVARGFTLLASGREIGAGARKQFDPAR